MKIDLVRQAIGQKDADYLVLKNKFHSVSITFCRGNRVDISDRFYTDGEKGFQSHSSLSAAMESALKELALYERGRAD